MKIIIAIALIVIVLLAVLWWTAENAPVGYEDETGFHTGVRK